MEFIKGMDLSTVYEVERCGGKFYDQKKEGDVFDILQRYGTNAVRLRLWNDPYDEAGRPYGAGTNDLEVTIALAKRALAHGMGFLLDLHYSDFWTDPGKQIKPKAWADFDDAQLEQAVYDFTLETLKKLKSADAYPTMIQIGNEVSNGLLWPNGLKPAYDEIARLISAGIRAVRALDRELPIMIHLDNGGNNELYRDWFDHYMERGEDFQIIGLSYYPFWHGTFADLERNMRDIAERYGKDLVVAEVSMGYTMEDYQAYEQLTDEQRKGMATKPALAEKIEYPMTPQGQSDFMERLMELIVSIPGGKGKGFFYWEPAWIPVPGSGWATPESLNYMKDPGPCGNEWANQALFDYEGNALPALETIKKFKS
jgi:arabinogalactan endo-1,4-beta-galactosidase